MGASRQIVTLLAPICFYAAAHAQQALVIEGGTVFDGTGRVRPNSSILVRGDRIESIASSGELSVPAGAQRIDARGKFVMPGMIDVHFHFNVRSDPRVSPSLPLLFLANGVTTLREIGNWIEEENKAWLSEVAAKGLPAPRLLFTGPTIDGRETALPDQSIVVFDENEARRAARRLMDEGATSLKVYSKLPLGLLAAVVEEASKRGVPVYGHLGIVDPRDAIRAGINGLCHTNMLIAAVLPPLQSEAFRQAVLRVPNPGSIEAWANVDPMGERATALMELMKSHHINLDPTLALHEPVREGKGPAVRNQSFRNMTAFTVRYHRAGGLVTVGSHGKAPYAEPGFAYLREMEILAEAGMPASDVLVAATRSAAEALRLKDRGVLAPGKLADVVLLDADPIANIANAGKVHAVILGGKILDRAALLAAAPRMAGSNR